MHGAPAERGRVGGVMLVAHPEAETGRGRQQGNGEQGGAGVRVDTSMYPGYEIPSYYDSMIAKLIVSAPDRAAAISRGRRALAEFHISGVKSTIPFHLQLLNRPEFIEGDVDTGLVEKMFSPAPESKTEVKV